MDRIVIGSTAHQNGGWVAPQRPFPVYLRDGETGTDRPLPPRRPLVQEVELVTRLASTRGGSNAFWRAGNAARRALNDAPFNPIARAVVACFEWEPLDARDCPSRLPQDIWGPDALIQGGSAVLNWVATVVREIPDDVGIDLLALARQQIRQEDLSDTRQGSLSCYTVPEPQVGPLAPPERPALRDSLRLGSGSRWLYNHCVIGHSGLVTRVADGTSYTLVRMVGAGGVLSPDHEDDWLVLGPGWWILSHPVPRGGGGGD